MAELNQLEQIRLQKIQELQSSGVDPFPPRAKRTHTAKQAIQQLETTEAALKEGETLPSIEVTVTGRIRAMRSMGKLTFSHIEDGTAKIQLFMRVNEIGVEGLAFFDKYMDIGDFVQATGNLMRTKTGEITVHAHEYKLLSKAVSPLPADKDVKQEDGSVVRYAALEDNELRARQRYADLAVNPEVRETFRKRAKIISGLRNFLDSRDFLEVETPILQPLYGGANARPFTTYHNQLKQELYLRISFELYLKRLLVGNLERVYEIGRDFRNEGVSFKHNPEFTQLEFYWAYADYLQVMELTEQMVSTVCKEVNGSYKINYQGKDLDFTPPWNRVQMRQGILDLTGIDISAHNTAEALFEAIKAKGYHPPVGATRGKLIDYLVGEFLEPSFIQPTFLYDYPRDISPLAKSKLDDPMTVERFEGYVAGFELCNAFTELNDPIDQEQRFIEMGRDYTAEDEELNLMDDDYLRAMRYGMPPNGGFGMGVDRLTMILTNKHSIREVLLFPHLRSDDQDQD